MKVEAAPLRWMGIEHAYADSQLAYRQLDRRLEIGIVRDDDCDLAVFAKGVEQQIRGKVHVGALLLGLKNSDGLWPNASWFRKPHMDRPRAVLAEMDREIGNRFESSEVGRLALRLAEVGRPILDAGGEVPDPIDFVTRKDSSE